MHLPFTDKDEIQMWAERYLEHREGGETYREADERIKMSLEAARHRGHMTHDDLRVTTNWKSRRALRWIGENTPDEVQEITSVSFAATTERLRIGALLALSGVKWPMASAILHFVFPDNYPIVDERVLRTIDWRYKNGESFNFNRWNDFTEACKFESTKFNVKMRDLDRALWYYDKMGMNR